MNDVSAKFPLLSAASCGVLVLGLLFGGNMHLYNLSVSVQSNIEETTLSIHPVIWCEVPEYLLHDIIGAWGMCYGNVIWTIREWRGTTDFDCVFPHEVIHSEQWHALGWLVYPARLVLPIEPTTIYDWSDPSTFIDGMWRPPKDWPNLWEFISISMRR